MRRVATGKLDHSAITIVWPDTASQLTNWRTSGLDQRIRGLAKFFPNALSPLPAAPAVPMPVAALAAELVQSDSRSPRVSPPPPPELRGQRSCARRALGPPADAAAGYACHASDDYPGFASCMDARESPKFGSETTWMSVFRSQTNAAVEIAQAVDPAFFRQGDVDRETQRLSRDFGQQARVILADLPSGGRARNRRLGRCSPQRLSIRQQ